MSRFATVLQLLEQFHQTADPDSTEVIEDAIREGITDLPAGVKVIEVWERSGRNRTRIEDTFAIYQTGTFVMGTGFIRIVGRVDAHSAINGRVYDAVFDRTMCIRDMARCHANTDGQIHSIMKKGHVRIVRDVLYGDVFSPRHKRLTYTLSLAKFVFLNNLQNEKSWSLKESCIAGSSSATPLALTADLAVAR